jgi:hypothetical protein
VTESEQLFRGWCRTNSLPTVRLPASTTPGRRRADFVVWRAPFRIFAAEIKQFDRNPEERRIIQDREAGKMVAHGGQPGHRVRSAIDAGSGQLRATTRGWWPGVLVVYDNTGLDYHTDAYHILTAMFGLEAVVAEIVPGHGILRRLGMRFAGRRKVTADNNRAISAIGRLYLGPEGEPRLDFFHNPYTTARLNPARWQTRTSRHFVLGAPDGEGRCDWVLA